MIECLFSAVNGAVETFFGGCSIPTTVLFSRPANSTLDQYWDIDQDGIYGLYTTDRQRITFERRSLAGQLLYSNTINYSAYYKLVHLGDGFWFDSGSKEIIADNGNRINSNFFEGLLISRKKDRFWTGINPQTFQTFLMTVNSGNKSIIGLAEHSKQQNDSFSNYGYRHTWAKTINPEEAYVAEFPLVDLRKPEIKVYVYNFQLQPVLLVTESIPYPVPENTSLRGAYWKP